MDLMSSQISEFSDPGLTGCGCPRTECARTGGFGLICGAHINILQMVPLQGPWQGGMAIILYLVLGLVHLGNASLDTPPRVHHPPLGYTGRDAAWLRSSAMGSNEALRNSQEALEVILSETIWLLAWF